MNREEADKIQIEEQTQIGRAEFAGDIVAENLAKWAYRRVKTWPDLQVALNNLLQPCLEANSAQHAGLPVDPDVWSRMFMAQNQAKAIIALIDAS